MRRNIALSIVGVLFFLSSIYTVRAEYVLPYPSYMPGNKLYTISRLIDRIKQPFYFGNISSYKYHLALADKYLVEAKTIFEYKQYLLAVDALSRSDTEFSKIPEFFSRAQKEGKDMTKFEAQLKDAAVLHKNTLVQLMNTLPATFEWKPEKAEATMLSFKDLLFESIMIRDNAIVIIQP